MSVRIRLTRVGATKRPAYRVVAIDKRRSRDGRPLEFLGFYNPLTEPATVQLETERINDWIGKGAQPSETVVKLMRQAEKAASAVSAASSPAEPEKPKRARTPKPKVAAPAADTAPHADEAAPDTSDSAAGS